MTHDDLWIGDELKLKKSGRIGTYEGKGEKGKARIKIKDNYVLTSFDNLELVKHQKPLKQSVIDSGNDQLIKEKLTSNVLDLHIEQLDPTLEHQLPQLILNKQISTCKQFLKSYANSHFRQVVIIHGVGSGQLKKEVHHILDGIPEVKSYTSIHNGGATLVELKF